MRQHAKMLPEAHVPAGATVVSSTADVSVLEDSHPSPAQKPAEQPAGKSACESRSRHAAKPKVTTGNGSASIIARLRTWPCAAALACVFADYYGLALLQPSLPYYLSELDFAEHEIPVWTGIISTAQFAAIVLGNVMWGHVSDRYGSRRALQLAMLGDTFFFALSAAAPFGARGAPSAGVVLTIVRTGAGLSTPLVSAITYIFDRVDAPEAVVRGLGLYAMSVILAYSFGGITVGALYEPVGWAGLNWITAVGAGLALTFVTFLSCPPISSERPKPKGIMKALCTPDFFTHAYTSLVVGYAMLLHLFMLLIILKENFLWSSRASGFMFLVIPCTMLPMNNYFLPWSIAKYGLHKLITGGSIMGCLASIAQAIWASRLSSGSEGGPVPLVCLFVVGLLSIMAKQTPNQVRGKYIADRYATNARGAVTGVSRNAFAAGQAISPIISGALYLVDPSLPYIVLAVLHCSDLLAYLVAGVSLFHDPPPCPPSVKQAVPPSAASELTSMPATKSSEMPVSEITFKVSVDAVA